MVQKGVEAAVIRQRKHAIDWETAALSGLKG
ncbi:Uncharacterised protein [Zhongshania aliphaticivorans]|uniref:Uncharacterized protein n=1 Tax=Zhongshania aliphaticivorans TaxID=1470434 RepID=A0A5S9MUF9_9GAMM|nr:Uncharacterised protein [Zhongshania aliphaticivorans]